MHAAPGEGIEVNWQGRDQCLAFASGHFRDLALVQRDATDQLHVEGNHVPLQRVRPHGDFTPAKPAASVLHDRESFRQYFVEGSSQLGVVLDG
jgi:hypothetical protein